MVKLNMEKINSRITKIVSSEEALRDVVPIDWSDEVLSGKKKVTITNATKEEERCVKLEISYS